MSKQILVREAANRLGVSIRRVLQLIESGRLKAEQVNARLWLVSAASCEKLRLARLQTIDGAANVGSVVE